jgi:hypothetical protein
MKLTKFNKGDLVQLSIKHLDSFEKIHYGNVIGKTLEITAISLSMLPISYSLKFLDYYDKEVELMIVEHKLVLDAVAMRKCKIKNFLDGTNC